MSTTAPTTARKPTDAEAGAVLDELRITLAKLEHRYAENATRYAEIGADAAVIGQRARLNLVRDLQELIGR